MAQPKPLPPVETLREYFSYDSKTGIVSRLKRTSNRTTTSGPVGTLGNRGYLTVGFQGRNLCVHRLAWKLHTGEEPPKELDHKNRDKIDNRWDNLRAASRQQNLSNKLKRRGKYLAGVSKNGRKWVAMHGRCGTPSFAYLGTFETEKEAHDAYVKWHREHYGEFSVYAAPSSQPHPADG